MSYNGWKNKETWLVGLWIGDSLTMEAEDGILITPEYVQSIVEDLVDDQIRDGFLRDLINCALGEIDYEEIASHYALEDGEDE